MKLTVDQEAQILALLRRGHSNNAIARAAGVALATVGSRRYRHGIANVGDNGWKKRSQASQDKKRKALALLLNE